MAQFLIKDDVKEFIEKGMTYQEISDHYRQIYPCTRGLSARTIQRFCRSNDINPNCTLSQKEKEVIVCNTIAEVRSLYKYFNPMSFGDRWVEGVPSWFLSKMSFLLQP